jgi:Family of unknown function (DUF6869)
MRETEEQFSQTELEDLARTWLDEIRRGVPVLERKINVASVSYDAPPEAQWQFILTAASLAESDEELAHIAAGPLEHLLGYHGEDYIGAVEKEAAVNPKFARSLTGVWQFFMSDELWSHLKTITAKYSEPLRPSTGEPDA